jgi:hypothetical protein
MEGTGRMTEIKIVTWNCTGDATLKKLEKIEKKVKADVYIIQECTKSEGEKLNKKNLGLKQICWMGYPKKGVGIFVKNDFLQKHQVKKLDNDKNYEYYVLCNIDEKLNILGIWAHSKEGSDYPTKLLDFLKNIDINKDFIIAGDLNLDKTMSKGKTISKGKYEKASEDIYNFLTSEERGLVSAYHS